MSQQSVSSSSSGVNNSLLTYPQKSLGNVSGLLRFDVFYSEEYNKIVYILGERHDKREICVPTIYNTAYNLFLEILIKLALDANHKLDVFLEIGYNPLIIKTDSYESKFMLDFHYDTNTGYLSDTLRRLHNLGCVGKDKLLCKYKGIRFHAADIRDTSNETMEYLLNLTNYINYCFIKKIYSDKECGKMLNGINSYKRNESVEILKTNIDNALKETKIMKQIENIPEKNKKAKMYIQKMYDEALEKYLPNLTKRKADKLQEYFNNLAGYQAPTNVTVQLALVIKYNEILKMNDINNIREIINDFITRAPSLSGKFSSLKSPIDSGNIRQVHEEVKRLLKDYDEDLYLLKDTTHFGSILMDMYLAARVFRGFREVDGLYSEEPKNIVIYAGDLHAGNYSKMFEDLGFTKIFSGKKTDKVNCLDLSGLKEFIFYTNK